jgi:recombinational DNA repair ATPase RecF
VILRDLRVEGFRCFRNEARLSLSPDRVSVLHGDNGSGKSTLLWALVRAFMDSFKAGGAAAEELRPWGTGLSPSIKVEFEHGGRSYRLSKAFLGSRGARLDRLEGHAYLPLHEKESVDEELRRMLQCEAKGAGLSLSPNWGIAQVLWAPQEGMKLGKVSGPVLESIRASLGGYIAGAGGAKLTKAVEDEYLKSWTPKGKVKAGSGLDLLMRELSNVEQLHQHWFERAALLPQRQKALIEQQEAIATLSARRSLLASERTQLAQQAEAYQRLQNEVVTTKQARDLGQERWKSVDGRIIAITLSRRQETELAGVLQDCDRQRAGADERLEHARTQYETEKTALDRLQSEALEIESLTQRWRAAGGYTVLLQAVPLAKDLERNQQGLAFHGLPADLPRLRKIDADLNTARARLEAALIFLEIVPDSAQQITVRNGAPAGHRGIEAGELFRATGSPVVEIEIAGVGVVRAGGPGGSAVELEAQVRSLEGEWTRLAGGPLDVVEKCASLREKLVAIAGTERQASAMEREKSEFERQYPVWVEQPPAPAAMSAEIEYRQTQWKAAHQTVSQALLEAQKDLGQAEMASTTLAHRRAAADAGLLKVREELRSLLADGMSEEQRLQARDAAALESQACAVRLKQTEEELSRFPADIVTRHQAAEKELATLETSLRDLEMAGSKMRGSLEDLLNEAPYDKLAAAEEDLAEARLRRNEQQLDADGTKLLRETLQSCGKKAQEGIFDHVASKATELLKRISGRNEWGAITLDGLSPQDFVPAAAGQGVGLENLSGGESEQVHLATRLALAKILTESAPHLVVLDDVLMATDDKRLGRILEILEEWRSRMQFLILTCHKDRYRALSGADFIAMEEVTGSRPVSARG